MRALLAWGAVTVGFSLACTMGRQPGTDAPEVWAPTYTVVSDDCGLAVHGYQSAFAVDDDDDGADGETWWVYSDADIVRGREGTFSEWVCRIEGGFACVPRVVGGSEAGDVIGWFEGDIANDHELDGTLELTSGPCVSVLDVWITKVPWRPEGEAIVPDEAACAEFEADPGVPGQGEFDDLVTVVYPASPHHQVLQNGEVVGEGSYAVWQLVAGPNDVVIVRDEQGACLDAWRVEHPEQVLVVGGPT